LEKARKAEHGKREKTGEKREKTGEKREKRETRKGRKSRKAGIETLRYLLNMEVELLPNKESMSMAFKGASKKVSMMPDLA
jgi:hypothetical protein